MLKCAYCDSTKPATREHVIPRWYSETPGERDTFNARAPVTQFKGDLMVKDVCQACNGGPLSDLDTYGHELYVRYFAVPVYADETVDFDYDGDRLIRWLLKMSFNSARVHNADARVLSQYRHIILGLCPLPDRVCCWLHLVPPTYTDPTMGPRPARREQRGDPEIDEPLWFRIAQMRLPSHPALGLVQRMVLINSFAFTLVVSPLDTAWPCEEFDQWVQAFSNLNPAAVPILHGGGRATAIHGEEHALATLGWLCQQYPSRFSDDPNPFLVKAIKGEMGGFLLYVPRELIAEGDVSPIAEILRDMVGTREQVVAYRQRVNVMVAGFDDDPRPLWQVPEAREFFRRLFLECPFVMLLAHPDGALLKLLMACSIFEHDSTEEAEKQRAVAFVNRAFQGLNDLTHDLALSEDMNRELCDAAMKTLFNMPLPSA
jgi:hypothetical protein